MRPLRLLAPLLLLAAGPAPAPPPAHPALWKLADADTTIWLFGSIHVLPAGTQWLSPRIRQAIAGSQSLTLEIADLDSQNVPALVQAMGRADNLPPLLDRVPAGKRAALTKIVAASGYPPATLDRLKTWTAAFFLTAVALQQAGLSKNDAGVEPQLTELFKAQHKPIEGLETARQQLSFFDRLPEKSQRAFLVATLEEPKKARADFDRMVAAWARGDPAALARAFAEDPEFTPELRDLLIRERDRNWADILAKRLDQPGTIFVAVGAGHLVGPDSVQKMLAAKGLKVTRIQ
ncbi:TraB/GumN family protein [Sphingomonas sp. ASY06-1R]|uniref:TraB/GumN family protein n=1 Tax=Sphingomonas sp. ASY06-1R TaxID=3445771 RepID=UPI003FA25D6D